MRQLLGLLVIGIWSGLTINAQPPGKADLTIRISAPVSTVKAGSDVYIKIQMTNTSDHPVDCSTYIVSGTDRRFRVEIKDENGNLMKKKDLHPEMMPGSFASCTLEPGESASREELASWASDLTRPGVYTVQVGRIVGNGKNDLVRSNQITITITP